MDGEINVIFLGGIADSGKSGLMEELNGVPGIRAIRISEFMKKPLGVTGEKRLSAGVIYRDWKSEAEEKTVKALGAQLKEWRKELETLKTLVINTHFATYSPGGYMMGLDPKSLQTICEHCNLCPKESTGKAATVLVDIGIGDALQRREEQWKKKEQWDKHEDVFPTGPGLVQDLEFNRIYALQYYHSLCTILDHERVSFYRVVVDYKQMKDVAGDLKETLAFKAALRSLEEFLIINNLMQK